MQLIKLLFFLSLFTIFYAYVGYGILLYLIIRIKNIIKKSPRSDELKEIDYEPFVSIVIPAYNEIDFLDDKIKNTYSLNYPQNKIEIIVITDGSSDYSDKYLKENYPFIKVLHEPERKGKSYALNKGLKYANGEIIIFTDANTYLNSDSIKNIVKHFTNPKVGCVAGSKRVKEIKDTPGEGESLYWKYEEFLKKLNSDFNCAIGAVGEILAVRKEIAQPIPNDTVIDDFVLSMNIAYSGYKVVFEPNAYAIEKPSLNEKEELKRKIRIATGAFQTLFRYLNWLNFFKTPILSFQYFSYKVLRWTFVPFCIPLTFLLNLLLFFYSNLYLYKLLFILQVFLYILVLSYYMKITKFKLAKIIFYILFMNYSMLLGFFKYIKGEKHFVWEKAKRIK